MSSALRAVALGLMLALHAPPAHTDEIARAQAIATPLLDDHPLALFEAAIEHFDDGHRAEGVYLFYLAQLRWRRFIAARPDLPPDQDRALFASLHDVFGRPINEWAFGDIDWFVALLRDLDAWDAATPDVPTPIERFPGVHAESRAGFVSFIDMIEDEADDIRANRLRNGLENR